LRHGAKKLSVVVRIEREPLQNVGSA